MAFQFSENLNNLSASEYEPSECLILTTKEMKSWFIRCGSCVCVCMTGKLVLSVKSHPNTPLSTYFVISMDF